MQIVSKAIGLEYSPVERNRITGKGAVKSNTNGRGV